MSDSESCGARHSYFEDGSGYSDDDGKCGTECSKEAEEDWDSPRCGTPVHDVAYAAAASAALCVLNEVLADVQQSLAALEIIRVYTNPSPSCPAPEPCEDCPSGWP